MKTHFTSKDFILLLGVAVAAIIAITTFFYRGSLISVQSSVSKKPQTVQYGTAVSKKETQILLVK